MKNILTIDLESWFHFDVEFFTKIHKKLNKELDNDFIVNSTELLLELLKKYKQKATFFVLGEVFQWYPSLIRKIKQENHEIAYHGHNHKKLLNKRTLKKQLLLSANFLKEFKPKGFRAADIYFKREYFSLLKEHNFIYDSSSYGFFKKKVETIEGIFEIPISSLPFRKRKNPISFPKELSLKLLCREFPFGSGYFLSLLKDKIATFIRRFNNQEIPVLILIHPWQMYNNPLNSFGFKTRYFWRQPVAVFYTADILKTLEKLLANYKFISIVEFLEDLE